jgi:periplasmic protein TonB
MSRATASGRHQRDPVFANAGEPTAGQLSAGQPAAGQFSAGRSTAGQPSASQLSAGQLSAGRSTAGQPTAGRLSAGDSETLVAETGRFKMLPANKDLANTGMASDDPANQPRLERRSGSRRLIITVVISLGLHVAAVTAVLLLLHPSPPAAVSGVEKPTEVELVMEEHKGDLRPTSTPSPSAAAPPAQKPGQQQAVPPEAKAAPPAVQRPDATEQTSTSANAASPAQARPTQEAKPSAEARVQEAKREIEPAPPAAQPAPVISLQGTDSPSNSRAFGDRVIPARPDAVFHNRPPVYPSEAALNGQQGVVVVVIHVSPAGTAVGVDLVRSSGYVLLDSAAREAVMRWRFLPAVRDGQPVASDMTMGFEFDNLR